MRAALETTGSTIMIAWSPPGWLCARRGGVFVKTVIASNGMAERLVQERHEAAAPLAASPCASYTLFSPIRNMSRAVMRAVAGEAGFLAVPVDRRPDAADVVLLLPQ